MKTTFITFAVWVMLAFILSVNNAMAEWAEITSGNGDTF